MQAYSLLVYGNVFLQRRLRVGLYAFLLALLLCAGPWVSRAQYVTLDAFNPDGNNDVYALALQPDGRILVGGAFTMVGGVTRNKIARLHADGSLDADFNPGFDNYSVYVIVVQPDGKILVGGAFRNIAGTARSRIARLNADGTLDAAFNPNSSSSVNALVLQPDGKIIVGGGFTQMGGQTRNRLARLNQDGTLDPDFNPNVSAVVNTLALQPDNKIIVGGLFTTIGGQARENIARLNADGTVDLGFNPGANASVTTVAVLSGGKILVGGGFTTLGGEWHSCIGRLNASGVSEGFPDFMGDLNLALYSMGLQADGKIVVSGLFTTVSEIDHLYIGRVYANGQQEPSFTLNADYQVRSLAMQSDGKILLGGMLKSVEGVTRNRFARLINSTAATETLSYGNGAITWLRGGAAAEVWRTTFELATNNVSATAGVQWTQLGAGTRITGGWSLDAPMLRLGTIRARGFTSGGYGNNSGGIIESIWGAPVFTNNPASVTNAAGTATTLKVGVIGSAPFGYAWRKDGVKISAGGRVTGTGADTLTITGLLHSDAGAYDVVVSNAYGCATSAVALVAVAIPFITAQPISCTNGLGTLATFSVEVADALPYVCQWRKDGVDLADGGNIAGATNTLLSLGNVTEQDVGMYDVVVSDACGSVTSTVASLTVVASTTITLQPVSRSVPMGSNVTFLVEASGVDLSYQWRHAGVVLSDASGAELRLTGLLPDDAGNYDAVVCGRYGCVTSSVAVLTIEQLDTGFVPAANGSVTALAVQKDNKILAGGNFTNMCGVVCNRIARLNANGTLDPLFNSSVNSSVFTMAALDNAKIMVGGNFSSLGGYSRTNLGQLNSNGVLNTAFMCNADHFVCALAVQADGKVLVGGWFTTLGSTARTRLARFNTDWSLDAGFAPEVNGRVNTLAVQSDGKILLAGEFSVVCGASRNRIARLNADGSLDTSFDVIKDDNAIACLAVQPDNKILVGGWFFIIGGKPYRGLARLNSDGSLDESFNPQAENLVQTIALQADNKILVGGHFTQMGGMTRGRLARLNVDGTLDSTFCAEANNYVLALALQADGKILVGGWFTEIGGAEAKCFVRLHNTGPATEQCVFAGSTITWQRGGTAPEVWRTTFEHSTNGTTWVNLGAGVRVASGWQLTGVAVTNGSIRARGYTASGQYNGSAGMVQSTFAVPPTAADTDNDGVPDWWTQTYFGHPTGRADDQSRAGDDASGTHQNNLFKYVAGLDPTNPASIFTLNIEAVPAQSNQRRLTFSPRWQDRIYTPLYCTNLSEQGSWMTLLSSSESDNGLERVVVDTNAQDTVKFYRVRIQQTGE